MYFRQCTLNSPSICKNASGQDPPRSWLCRKAAVGVAGCPSSCLGSCRWLPPPFCNFHAALNFQTTQCQHHTSLMPGCLHERHVSSATSATTVALDQCVCWPTLRASSPAAVTLRHLYGVVRTLLFSSVRASWSPSHTICQARLHYVVSPIWAISLPLGRQSDGRKRLRNFPVIHLFSCQPIIWHRNSTIGYNTLKTMIDFITQSIIGFNVL